ncbi:MAG: hypothetical protein QM759_15230 [Terricaulis sp.]
MRFDAPLISNHKLRRRHRWILLWLTWFASFLTAAEDFAPLSAQAIKIAHNWLDCIERRFLSIVIFRAAFELRRIRPGRLGARCTRVPRAGVRRAYLGSVVRRAVRAKDLRERIVRLSQDANKLAAHIVRRLRRGLTRIRPIVARPDARCADARPRLPLPAARADTS